MKGRTIIGLMMLAACLAVQPAGAAEEKPIKIGVICGMSGYGYSYTSPYLHGVKLAVEEVNKNPPLGRKFELVIRDDEIKVDTGVREMRYLVMRANVDLIIGGFGSHIALAESEIAKETKTPYIVCLANSFPITEAKGHRYVFQLPPSTRMEGNAVAEYIAQQPIKKIWTIGQDYEFGRTLVGIPMERLKVIKPEIQIIGQSWPKMNEKEMTAFITQIMAANPDLVYNVQWGADMVAFVKQAKPFGMFNKFKFAGIFDLPLLTSLGAEMVEGVIGFSRGDFFAVKTPEMAEFAKKYNTTYNGEYPTSFSAFGYEAILAAADAIRKAGTTDKEKVTDALTGLKFRGPRGEIYFRDVDNIASGSVYVGKTVKDPAYPFCIFKDIVEVPASKSWLPPEEIKKLRAEQK